MEGRGTARRWDSVLRYRKLVYIVMGVLCLIMVALSFAEVNVLSTTPDFAAFGAVASDAKGYPPADQKGAFILLNDRHSSQYPSSLVALLPLSEPGVVAPEQGAHLASEDIKAVLVQADAVGDGSEYRIYRIADPEVDQLAYVREPGGKDMQIAPKSGTWKPGAYVIDIPSAGMFGGRDYFQFYVDAKK